MGSLEYYEGKRESYWIYRIDLPPELGKSRRQKKVVRDRKTGKRWTSKRACREAMQAHEVELRTGVPVQITQQTMAEYMELWLSDASKRLAPSTVLNYRDSWRRVSSHLASIQVQVLQTLAIQQAIRDLEKRYAPDTVRLTYRILHIALRQAVRWQIISRNPAEGVVLPASKPVTVKNAWTVEEVQRFLANTQDDDLHVLWRLLLDTGMRIGEALALGWEHVQLDPAPARVRIERTLTRSGKAWYVGNATKTKRSRRTLTIQPETASSLRSWRAAQDARRATFGPYWQDTGLVFDRGGGDMMHTNFAADRLAEACVAAQVPRRTPHELRHTFTTLAAQRGVPLKLIADRLGHANTDLIAGIYAHVTEEGDLLVSEALRSVLNPPIPANEPASCLNDDAGSEISSNGAKSSDEEYYRA